MLHLVICVLVSCFLVSLGGSQDDSWTLGFGVWDLGLHEDHKTVVRSCVLWLWFLGIWDSASKAKAVTITWALLFVIWYLLGALHFASLGLGFWLLGFATVNRSRPTTDLGCI